MPNSWVSLSSSIKRSLTAWQLTSIFSNSSFANSLLPHAPCIEIHTKTKRVGQSFREKYLASAVQQHYSIASLLGGQATRRELWSQLHQILLCTVTASSLVLAVSVVPRLYTEHAQISGEAALKKVYVSTALKVEEILFFETLCRCNLWSHL